jgi:ribokinase
LFGDVGVFSFYPVKHMTTAEGGIIISKNKNLIKQLRLKKAFGVNKTFSERKIPGSYDCVTLGFNYRMSELNAAIGIEQVKKLKDVTVLIAQCEIPQEVTLAAFRTAQELGITTILNPAPYQPLTDDLLDLTDWLIPNEIEFSELDKSHREPDSDEVIASLRNKGRTIVTLGSEGAALVTKDGHVKRFTANKVSATDTTGAGDCFIGAFAAALASGATEESAVQFGIDCATKSVMRKGAQSSYPTLDEFNFSLISK